MRVSEAQQALSRSRLRHEILDQCLHLILREAFPDLFIELGVCRDRARVAWVDSRLRKRSFHGAARRGRAARRDLVDVTRGNIETGDTSGKRLLFEGERRSKRLVLVLLLLCRQI